MPPKAPRVGPLPCSRRPTLPGRKRSATASSPSQLPCWCSRFTFLTPNAYSEPADLPALLQLWPGFLSYLASFVTIGVIWLNHHAVFAKVGAVDRTVQWSNLLLLLTVAFIPFPNTLVAEALGIGLTGGLGLIGAWLGTPWIPAASALGLTAVIAAVARRWRGKPSRRDQTRRG